jgi:hypothetical protein
MATKMNDPREQADSKDVALSARLSELGRATERAEPKEGFAVRLSALIERRLVLRRTLIAFSSAALVAALGVGFWRHAHAELAGALITAFDATYGADP